MCGRCTRCSRLPAAGYEAISFDNRGVPPTDVPSGNYSLADMVADTAGLIEALAWHRAG